MLKDRNWAYEGLDPGLADVERSLLGRHRRDVPVLVVEVPVALLHDQCRGSERGPSDGPELVVRGGRLLHDAVDNRHESIYRFWSPKFGKHF